MCSQQFSERLKAAKFDDDAAELSSLNMTPSSSSHTSGALSGPETLVLLLLLFSMILQRERDEKDCLKKEFHFFLTSRPSGYTSLHLFSRRTSV